MTPRAQSRKHRGYATQRLIAERWRQNGMAPYAKAAGAGESGKDILDVIGLSVEIKARDTMSLPACLRQARASADIDDIPIAICRHNGQGEAQVGQFTVSMDLADFEVLWVMANEDPMEDW